MTDSIISLHCLTAIILNINFWGRRKINNKQVQHAHVVHKSCNFPFNGLSADEVN